MFTVADRIKQRREELGLTQLELAKRMGYAGKSAISRAETSGDDIGANRIEKFAKALSCSPSYLMGWDEEPAPAPNVENYETHVELIRLFDMLTEEQQKAIIHMMHTMANC